MFHFDEEKEGKHLVSSLTHRLEFQVYTFLGRWVMRDIADHRLDTRHRLHTEWIDRLTEWRRSAERQKKHDAFIVFGLLCLGMSPVLIKGFSLYVAVLTAILLGVFYFTCDYRKQTERLSRIEKVRDYSLQVMKSGVSQPHEETLSELRKGALCKKLKDYLEHHDDNELYQCQVRGILDYQRLALREVPDA